MKVLLVNAKPSKKVKIIQLKTYGRSWREVRELGNKLIENLGDNIFSYPTRQILLFNILKQISLVNKNLKIDDNSIESACEKVIRYFGLDNEASIAVSTKTGWREIKSKKKSNTEKFCEIVIEIDKVPSHIYEQLSIEVNEDLLKISDLIKWYETHLCIQKYNKENGIPKSHEERILYDFYKRCVAERVEILNYQLYGLKERALNKARYRPSWFSGMMSIFEKFHDRPYHFSKPFSIQYFDYRKIDLAGHRVGEYSIEESVEMEKLYFSNKAKFYRKCFKKIPVQQHFQNFSIYLSCLPLKNNRKPIFDELIRLFKAHSWISFYALALPQVEGLFSEMCEVVSPEKDLSQKSLTHKVNLLRPFHNLSRSYFDYFQYHIPLQRNRFSHTGYDEDFKLKSYDLLVDLSHLLKIFYELDNPLVKIKKLHTRRNIEDFISMKEFADYFKLLNALKPTQLKEIMSDVNTFEKEFLCQDCSLDYTCYEMMQDLPKMVSEFVENVNTAFKLKHENIEFEKLNKPQIDKLLEVTEQLETMKDCFIFKSDKIEKVEGFYTFFTNQKKYLPSLKAEIITDLEKMFSEHKTALKNIVNTKATLSI